MKALATGVVPTKRHDDKPFTAYDMQTRLTPGVPVPTLALLQLRGDWEWYTQGLAFPSANAVDFCWRCNATQHRPDDVNKYDDFSDAAGHRKSVKTHADYVASCAGKGTQKKHIHIRSASVLLF